MFLDVLQAVIPSDVNFGGYEKRYSCGCTALERGGVVTFVVHEEHHPTELVLANSWHTIRWTVSAKRAPDNHRHVTLGKLYILSESSRASTLKDSSDINQDLYSTTLPPAYQRDLIYKT